MPERPAVAVSGIVLEQRDDGLRVLLVKRGRPPQEGTFTLPGGRVELGERLADALTRELREETGLEVRIGPLVEAVEVIELPYHYVILDYVCERIGGELRAGDDATEAVFVRASDITYYSVTDTVARVIGKAIEMAGAGED